MYERFFNYATEPLCIADFDGKFVDVNESFCRLLGYSKDFLLSTKFVEFIHPDDLEATQREITNSAQGNDTIDFENRYIDCNGVPHVLRWKAFSDISTQRIFAVAKDVTQEKIAINEYQQLYKAITNNVIFAKTDTKGVIVDVNDKFVELSGYAKDELTGMTHRVVNSGVHSDVFFSNMWQRISSGKVWTGTITNKKKNGELYHLKSIITPNTDINGEICSYTAIRFDITAQVRLKKEALETLTILNETSSIAKVGGWELNIASGELTWTDETFKLLGIEKKSGRKPVLPEGLQLFTDEHKPIIDNAVSRAIEFGEPYALELQARLPTGEVKWIFTNGRPNYKDGKIESLTGTIQDINERKLIESKYNAERLKSIQTAKFAALGELSASIAHEINNPVGIISGYTELLKMEANGSSNNKLNAILKSCDRIAHIVKNLERFSHSEDTPTKSEVNLSSVIDEAISLTTPNIKRNLVAHSCNNIKDAIIWANYIEIEQVVINLINNAIDAIKDKKERWIRITMQENTDKYVLSVTDSGLGIPEQTRRKMFEPFFTTKGIGGGTGLGLSIIQSILADHNSSITLDENSSNTCFVIHFPKFKKEYHNV